MRTGRIGWLGLGLAIAIVFFQIILQPPIGLADNGDFAKIIGTSGLVPLADHSALEAPGQQRFEYFYPYFVPRPNYNYDAGFRSSESVLFNAAKLLNKLVFPPGGFDIRAMGIVHASIFLLALGLTVPLFRRLRFPMGLSLLVAAILIFCDVLYSSYYSSFYTDAGAFVWLLLALVLLVRGVYGEGRPEINAWLGVASCAFFLTAKTQHALLAVPFAVFLVWKRGRMWPRRSSLCSGVAAAVVIAAGIFSLTAGSPRGYASPVVFNVIFTRILPLSENVSADLASLGLNDSYAAYKGLFTYSPNSPMEDENFKERFFRRTSFGRVAKFYFAHPILSLKVANLGMKDAAWVRPAYLGNYSRQSGRPAYTLSHAFSLWSDVKHAVFQRVPWLCALGFVISVAVVIRRFPLEGVLVGCMGLLEFVLSTFGDSLEGPRHLFLFHAIWDIACFGAICVLGLLIEDRLSKRKGSEEAEELASSPEGV